MEFMFFTRTKRESFQFEGNKVECDHGEASNTFMRLTLLVATLWLLLPQGKVFAEAIVWTTSDDSAEPA